MLFFAPQSSVCCLRLTSGRRTNESKRSTRRGRRSTTRTKAEEAGRRSEQRRRRRKRHRRRRYTKVSEWVSDEPCRVECRECWIYLTLTGGEYTEFREVGLAQVYLLGNMAGNRSSNAYSFIHPLTLATTTLMRRSLRSISTAVCAFSPRRQRKMMMTFRFRSAFHSSYLHTCICTMLNSSFSREKYLNIECSYKYMNIV